VGFRQRTQVARDSQDQMKPHRLKSVLLVFERLNTGGQQLNPQELRNCLYAGGFNELLIKLSRLPLFTDIWEIPAYDQNVDKHGQVSAALRENVLYQRMKDCEIVLRFFAFRKRANIKGSVRFMLDRCMEENLSSTQKELADLQEEFHSRLQLARDIFGEQVFRYRDEEKKWQLSQPLYDGIMVAIDNLWSKRDRLLKERVRIVREVKTLLRKPSAFEVIVGRPNTARAVRKRMDILLRAVKG
jgi:hypothetical protein